LQILSVDDCLARLNSHVPRVGRVGVVSGGRLQVLPVNYAFFEGAVVFRTTSGAKLAAAQQHADAAFEIDEVDAAWEEGWSIVVHGRLEEVTDPAELERLADAPLRPWGAAAAERGSFVRIVPQEITGRSLV
jgi:nitroimidazol reductase NimA-like FMN-containing flavoprotein (pyridoxamine 5'-phosphate oxidase superfamily)